MDNNAGCNDYSQSKTQLLFCCCYNCNHLHYRRCLCSCSTYHCSCQRITVLVAMITKVKKYLMVLTVAVVWILKSRNSAKEENVNVRNKVIFVHENYLNIGSPFFLFVLFFLFLRLVCSLFSSSFCLSFPFPPFSFYSPLFLFLLYPLFTCFYYPFPLSPSLSLFLPLFTLPSFSLLLFPPFLYIPFSFASPISSSYFSLLLLSPLLSSLFPFPSPSLFLLFPLLPSLSQKVTYLFAGNSLF